VLDGDHELVNEDGVKASRDIVQFVPFWKYESNPDQLAQQLLAELPGQVVEYMRMIQLCPGQYDLIGSNNSVGH